MSAMSDLKINTDAVVAAANNIKNCNNQIRENFSSVQTALSCLDKCWEGSAASYAIGKFNEMKSKFPDARYSVLDNYVKYLLQLVGEGYIQSEEANISLADQFK